MRMSSCKYQQSCAADLPPWGGKGSVGKSRWVVGCVAFLALAGTGCNRDKAGMESSKPVSVAVAKVVREDLSQDVVFEAELRPWQEIDLHAKIAGFLENITVDVGDHVKAGQLLATLKAPELEDEIQRGLGLELRSEAEVKRAEADYTEAHLAYMRLAAVDKSNPRFVAQQDIETAQARDATSAATLAAARDQVLVAHSEVARVKTMLAYARISAPFAGIITKRLADPGALIQAATASSSQTLPLVHLAQMDLLRLVCPISVSFVSRVKIGDELEIQVPACGQKLSAKIVRMTRKLEAATRTMEVEADIPNPSLTLIAGMDATVGMRLERRKQVLAVPVEAVSRTGKDPTVFLINREQGNEIEERPVTLGLETAASMEVTSGLRENDLVIVGNRAQLHPGLKVEPKLVEVSRLKNP